MFLMDSKGFDNEFIWSPKEFQRIWFGIWLIPKRISKEVTKSLIDFQMNSKGLTMNLIDFQKNFWGFAKKFDRFSQGFGKEFIWFLKSLVKIFQ